MAGAAVLFGTPGTAQALSDASLSSWAVGAWRSVIGGVALVAAAVLRGVAPWRYRTNPVLAIAGGLTVIAYQMAFFAAVERIGVAAGTVITIGTGPAAAGAIDWWLRAVRPRRQAQQPSAPATPIRTDGSPEWPGSSPGSERWR